MKAAGERTALFLYAVLVVLPAVVFGGLLAHQLTDYQRREIAAVPASTHDAAARFVAGVVEQVQTLIDEEAEREFYHYQQDYYGLSTMGDGRGSLRHTTLSSPMLSYKTDAIVAWFSWSAREVGTQAPVILPAPRPERWSWTRYTAERKAVEAFVEDDLMPALADEPHIDPGVHDADPKPLPIDLVALNLSEQRDPDCVRQNLDALFASAGRITTIGVRTTPFELLALRDGEGRLRVTARRGVWVDRLPEKTSPPECFPDLGVETRLTQGLVFDTDWLLSRLPNQVARQILSSEMRLTLPDGPEEEADPHRTVVRVDLFEALGAQTRDPGAAEVATMGIVTTTSGLRHAFRIQLAWLAGVTIVMTMSLVIGILLLVGSVRASQEHARRTDNFVAAVTHELRTPVTAVKMFGEMLLEGWTQDEGKREEYLSRIVRETDRLDALVDRLLRKRKLTAEELTPSPGDLNEHVSLLIPELEEAGGRGGADLAFDLQPGLPPVLLLPDSVRDVLVNLVENARKYAAVPEGGEPIRVVTRRDRRGNVVLEVLDRGPGIPEGERSRVFDAFYRVGDERTRRAAGAGLGLHLVDLQARSMRARVQAQLREGGGAVLRVTFRTLKSGAVG